MGVKKAQKIAKIGLSHRDRRRAAQYVLYVGTEGPGSRDGGQREQTMDSSWNGMRCASWSVRRSSYISARGG